MCVKVWKCITICYLIPACCIGMNLSVTHAAQTLSNDPSAVTCTSRRALKTSFTGNTTLDRGMVPVFLAEADFSIDNASDESCDRTMGWGASF